MARPARTTCKFEGCDQPIHVYPGGWKSPYCRDHMRLRKSLERDGLPSCTGPMRAVLRYLAALEAAGYAGARLDYPVADHRTVMGLLNRHWIFLSRQLDVYMITEAGRAALDVYGTARKHTDGICPRCGERPRYTRTSGLLNAYCRECERARGRRRYAERSNMGDIHRPCTRCGERPRHQYPNGRYSTYCRECDLAVRSRNWQQQRQAQFARIQAGGPVPLCRKCKQRPVKVFEHSFSAFCADCLPGERRAQKLRRVYRQGWAARP